MRFRSTIFGISVSFPIDTMFQAYAHTYTTNDEPIGTQIHTHARTCDQWFCMFHIDRRANAFFAIQPWTTKTNRTTKFSLERFENFIY